jgi:hypothetical protein
MLTSVLFALAAFQSSIEEWPLGAFDISGEMTYQEAASTIGMKPPTLNRDFSSLMSDLKKDIRNPVLWKAVADKSFATQNSQAFYEFCIANTPGKLNQPKDEAWDVLNARGYVLYAIKQQLENESIKVDGNLRSRWRELVRKEGHIYGARGATATSSEMLVQLTRLRGSPEEWRDMIAKFKGSLKCKYYLGYALAESYLFSSVPVDDRGRPAGKEIQMDKERCTLEYKKLRNDFPTKPTPCYKLATLYYPKEPTMAKVYAAKYLELENRPFKTRWKSRMTTFVKTGVMPIQ